MKNIMPLKLDYEFLFVGRDENSFLENYSCDLEKEKGANYGQIFANIEVKNNPIDAEDIAVCIYDTMQTVFFEDLALSPYERFEATLKVVNKKLLEFSSLKDGAYIGNLNVLISARVGDELFLSQTGEAEAYLIRKRFVSVVSEGLSDEKSSDDIFSNIASGNIETNDFILFTNTRVLRYMSKNDLAMCIRKAGVSETLVEIRDLLSTEMLGRLSMIGVNVLECDKEIATEDAWIDDYNVDEDSVMEKSTYTEDLMKNDGIGEFSSHEERTIIQKKKKYDFSKGKNIFTNFFSFFGRIFKGKGSSNNKLLAILLGIIVLLVVSIFLANNMSDKRKKLDSLDKVLESVQAKITEAETKGTYDKESAAMILDKAYSEALSVLNSGYYRDKANLYLVQINETRDRLDQVNRVENDSMYIDLTKVDPSINALGFVEFSGRRFVYTENKLYEITLDSVSSGIDLDSSESVYYATAFNDRKSIVFLTNSGKLMEYREGTISFLNTEDTVFKKSVAIDDWANRVYLLDAEEGQIWKYTFSNARERFGVAEGYFSNALEEIIGAKDFVIDSYIYVLDASSKILRYYGGNKSEVTIVNAPYNGFKTANKIYTNDQVNKLYLIDDKANRVFVFDKDNSKNRLSYMSQYLFDSKMSLRGVLTDKDSGRIYVLTDKAIYEL